jgi:dynein heavy chain
MKEDEPSSTEKDILRYYYYIHNGIDTEYVAPLEPVRLKNVMSLIPEKLRQYHLQTVADLSDQIREDYLLSVKKAIVDFVLKDSRKEDGEKRLTAGQEQVKNDLEALSKLWHHNYERSVAEVGKSLHAINPCMAQVLRLWYTTFE